MPREQLLLIPGPTPVHPRIINSLSLPTVSHVSPVFVEEFKQSLIDLKVIVSCNQGQAFIVSGAGTLAMEMALVNTVGPGEKILVLSQGYFGNRMQEIAHSFGLRCEVLESPWGEAVLPFELEEKIEAENYAAVVATHVDTATGACAPVKEYARVIKEKETLFIVDGVCATGGIEEKMDDWGIDVIFTAAQKCFGVPPGLAVLVLSEAALSKRRSLGSVPAYYADLMRWLPIMRDPSRYFSTPCVNEIRAFAEGARLILEEGLEARFQRHSLAARAIRAAFQRLGFSFFTQEVFWAETLSVVYYPPGIGGRSLRGELLKRGIVVAGGLGDLADKVFRMGHMGNLSISQIFYALEALEDSLNVLGYNFESGVGVRAAKNVLKAS